MVYYKNIMTGYIRLVNNKPMFINYYDRFTYLIKLKAHKSHDVHYE